MPDAELAERFQALIDGRAAASEQRPRPVAETTSDHGGIAAMSMPFYVAPEQVMKDRADYARKGIARGRSLVALICDEGILICAENPSTTLRKVSEIYDRIAFAGVGKYNEFDQLRIAGVRHADLKGYSFSREDVDARSLANQYAQILGQIFTHEMKPMEVEILVAEVGADPSARPAVPHPLRRHGHRRGPLQRARRRRRGHRRRGSGGLARPTSTSPAALRLAVAALAGPDRTLHAGDLEVALLDRSDGRRASAASSDDGRRLLPAVSDRSTTPADARRRSLRRPRSPRHGAPMGAAGIAGSHR